MKFMDYKVGLVVNRAGLTDGQLAVIRKMLSDIARHVEDGGKIELYIPGWDVTEPEQTIPAEVVNLRYREKVRVHFLGYPAHEGGGAESICTALELFHRVDEVWCAPAMTHSGRSLARVNQVWTLGQAGRRARMYKRVQPWASMPEVVGAKPKPAAKKQATVRFEKKKGKGKKVKAEKFRSMFNENFNW